jgi:hypothetical protein
MRVVWPEHKQDCKRMAQSNADIDNFLQVDLTLSSAVRLVKIYNRRDGSTNYLRLNYMEVYVGDEPRWQGNARCDPALIPTTWTLAMGQSQAWAYTFPCALTGRYVTFHIPGGGNNFINVMEMQVFAANACPTRSATGATQVGGSICAGAGWGQACTFQCLAGWQQVSGSESSACNGIEWDAPELVCQPVCPELSAPPYAASCSQSQFCATATREAACQMRTA